jgi:hypothetical protein
MDAIEGEDDHHDEVGDEQGDVEGVPAIGVAKGVVGVVGLPVVPEAVVIGEEDGERVEVCLKDGGSPRRAGVLKDFTGGSSGLAARMWSR